MNFLVGLGQDSHKFINKKPLILGGVHIPSHKGLKGNSDADVVLHAVFNAISSAIGDRSIGFYADPMCKDQGITNSAEYLKVILKKVYKKKLKINNLSISIEAKTPKIELHVDNMKKTIAKILNTKIDQVGITATSGEELTAFGKGEGMQVFAVVSLVKK